MGSSRFVVALSVVVAMLVVGLLPTRLRPEPPVTVAAPAHTVALDVLHRWDAARSRAWATGDGLALRRLYVEGSAAGRADIRLLHRYRARGFQVHGLTMQLLAVRVLKRAPGALSLRVTDRLAGGVAVADGRRVRLPGDGVSTRTLVLRRTTGGWRMASVR